ncbi:MAG: HAMP domain-containing histidine kinase [Roseburia sp.]|jgi:signal transduction histidine kinase|nr:HAMP domain-containing histidine kinase [Roseburia sp.]
MIKKLQKKLTTLLIFLLTIIWIGILLLFLNSTYKNNLKDVKEDVRSALREIKWKNFIRTQGTALDLEDIGYCVFQIDDYKQPHILFQTFTNKTDEELLRYAKKYSLTWKKTHQTYKYIYIYKLRKKQLMLISSAPALQATIPAIVLCIFLLFGGLILFTFSSRIISRWLTQPIEDMISSEKKFISNASHELKTPLAVIRANTQLLQKEISADNKHLEYIHQETERMIVLVNKMLTLVRLDTAQNQAQPKRFRVDEALYDIIYPMESVAYEKKIRMTVDIQEEMYIDGIEDQIQNLLSILLNNAISYTPEYGEIVIRAYIQAKKFYLKVSNSGDPIPEEIRDRLFERFFRADEAREDNGHYGLGLSIASSIAANHGGRIRVDYEDHKNVFSVVLNAHSPAQH